jgi:Sulfite exporter TauE/SafE/Transposase IS116/IS110/IS902 family
LFGVPLSILLVAFGALLLAGFVKGFIGMGLPTIATGLLTLVMAPGQAAGLLVVPNFSTNAWQALAGIKLRALVRRFWPMLLGICVGSTPGAGFLANDTSGRASMALGVLLVAYALMSMVSPRLSVPPHTEWWLAPVVGTIDREQGISKAGNPRLRHIMVELAWLWVRHQPDSALTRRFRERVGAETGRVRRIAIVALARKLLIALWRYVNLGEVPEGAVLKPV